MAAQDDCYKMPMRRWLPHIIDNKQIEGLEWLDSSRTYFKIPWMKKDYPGWQNCERLVQEWAGHQGRQEKPGVSSDFSTLKSNFRNAIHKCEDFDTDDEKSELNNQTGNYKVYKLLTRNEVEVKKDKKKSEATRKRKKGQKCSSKGKLACPDPNIDDGTIKTIGKEILLPCHSSNPASSSSCFLPHIAQNIESDSVVFDPLLSNFQHLPCPAVCDDNYNFFDQPPQAQNGIPVSANLHPESAHSQLQIFGSQCNVLGNPISCSNDCDNTGASGNTFQNLATVQCTEDLQVPHGNISMSPTFSFNQLLRYFDIPQTELSWCSLCIKYNNSIVLAKMLTKSEIGYRIFYGDEGHQKTVARMHHNSEEVLADYELPTIHLPEPTSHYERFQEILDKTALGVVFKYDLTKHSFWVKRLCQSQVFYLNPHDDSQNQEPIKLNRQEEICVFSFEKYLQRNYQYQLIGTNKSVPMIEPVIYMSIGSKSNLYRGNASPRGLKLEITPCALKSFQEGILSSGDTSLYFSRATPEEEMLRRMRNVEIVD